MNDPSFLLAAIDEVTAELLRQRGGPVHVADEFPGYPCRQCLDDARIGEELILVSHDPFSRKTEYRSASPILLHRTPCTPSTRLELGALPVQLTRRQLSVRSFDRYETMIDAAVIDGASLEATITTFFENPRSCSIHVHNASRGCWAVSVVRRHRFRPDVLVPTGPPSPTARSGSAVDRWH